MSDTERKRIPAVLICARCDRQFQQDVWNPTQPPKYCSDTCRYARPIPALTRRELAARQRRLNRAFIRELNVRTFCAHCGAQPIEWHNPEHVNPSRQRYRISDMVQSPRSIAAIKAEIARCTPLCRRCHMAEDGRLRNFLVMAALPKTKPAQPCVECGRVYKPLRRGLCGPCSGRQRYYRKTPTGENLGAFKRRAYARRVRVAS